MSSPLTADKRSDAYADDRGTNGTRYSGRRRQTIYQPEVAQQIKAEVIKVWKRVQENRGLTQVGLAEALGATQGAVSKLLNDTNGHPWTGTHLKKFSAFCGISPKSLLSPINADLTGFVTGWDVDDAVDDRVLEECLSGLTRYYEQRGLSAKREELISLAVSLAHRLQELGNADDEQFRHELEKIVLEKALRAR